MASAERSAVRMRGESKGNEIMLARERERDERQSKSNSSVKSKLGRRPCKNLPILSP
jgi:hypothetical protein